MEIITGYAAQAHVTAAQDASINRGLLNVETAVLDDPTLEEFEAQIQTNNIIRIRSGLGILQGRAFWVAPNTYDEVNFANGTQGENRIDLVTARYERNAETAVETITWNVIQGTPTEGSPTPPAHTEGNIDDGDNVVDLPMFNVTISGINITGVTPVYDTCLNMTLTEAQYQDLTDRLNAL